MTACQFGPGPYDPPDDTLCPHCGGGPCSYACEPPLDEEQALADWRERVEAGYWADYAADLEYDRMQELIEESRKEDMAYHPLQPGFWEPAARGLREVDGE